MKKVHCSQVRFGYVQVTFEMEQEQRTCMHAQFVERHAKLILPELSTNPDPCGV